MSFASIAGAPAGEPSEMNLSGEPTPVGDAEPASEAAPRSEAFARAAQMRADFRLFAGPNAEAFVQAAADGEEMRRRAGTICWPGLLAPPAWFLYRKMYGYAAFTVLAPVLVSLVQAPGGITRWIGFGLSFLGAFGNRLYLAKARKLIAEIRAEAPDEASARETIGRAGGASPAGAVIGVLLMGAFAAFAFLKT